jgi:hypothetical protein
MIIGDIDMNINANPMCQEIRLIKVDSICNAPNLFNDSVYPGDANADFVANILDILPIGLNYGNTGTVRSNANNAWFGQASTDWTNTIPYWNNNEKHADCNGDGIINAADTTAIILNYGYTHNKGNGIQQANANDPILSLSFLTDTAAAGSIITVPINLGSLAVPANNIYGIAFTLNYNNHIVKNMNASFNNSWLGNLGSNMIALQHNDTTNGELAIGLVRIDHTNVSGIGQIATLTLQMKDDVSGKVNMIAKTLNMTISNIRMIDNAGNTINATGAGDSVVVTQEGVTAINSLSNLSNSIQLYPNPAKESFNIILPDNNTVHEITVTNILGNVVEKIQVNKQNKVEVNSSSFSKGVYFIKINTQEGNVVKRISISE